MLVVGSGNSAAEIATEVAEVAAKTLVAVRTPPNIDTVRDGRVRVVPAVEGFDGGDVLLAQDRRVQVDDVIAATGFRPALEPVLGHLGVLSESGRPRAQGDATVPGYPGLYFVGMREQLAGLLHVIGKQARAVARAIGREVQMSG